MPVFFTPQPSRQEGCCVPVRAGRHISESARWIFSVQNSMELAGPEVVQHYGHLPICHIWVCPWSKNLLNLVPVGSRLCRRHIFKSTRQIYSIRSSMELCRLVVVQRHSNLPMCPIWACPWAKNLSNQVPLGFRLCQTHISETTGWIYTIPSSMELSKPVIVQHHGLMTLTWEFQGQMLKKQYHRNKRAHWHVMKGMWINRKWDTLCGFVLWPLPWPWPWLFMVKFWKAVFQEWEGPLTWNKGDVNR